MSKLQQSPKYLPFNRFHQAPISGLSPTAIKKAVKEMLKVRDLRDREKISSETAQNFICKSFGFSGGFAGFQKEYNNVLRPFMIEHGLFTPANLVRNGRQYPFVKFTYRKIAERLFQDEKIIPKRVFTGLETYINTFFMSASESQNFSVIFWPSGEEIKPRPNDSLGCYAITNSEGRLLYGDIFAYINMLGDQFLDYGGEAHSVEIVPKIYFPKTNKNKAAEEASYISNGRVLRSLLLELNFGWVDVIPYNANLIFLRYKNGGYDFVFRGMRDTPFQHNLYSPYLRNSDVPATGNMYDFQRWLYFPSNKDENERRPYTGWLEFDEHEAEKMFYAVGGTSVTHPGLDELLRDYLIGKGTYKPPQETAGEFKGFYPCVINTEKYFVSNLVSQHQFKEFMHANSEYRDYSRKASGVDDWETVNCDEGDLPAAVTWYDAMAYTAWISKTHRLPVRLLEEEEYRSVASSLIPIAEEGYFETYFGYVGNDKEINGTIKKSEEGEFIYENTAGDVGLEGSISLLAKKWCAAMNRRICHFESIDGTPYLRHPPYMAEEDFQKLIFKFNSDALTWKENANGLWFINSPYFGEWLKPEAAAIDTFLLCSLTSLPFDMASASRRPFSPTSTGKYKSTKIGFRLIYKGHELSRERSDGLRVS